MSERDDDFMSLDELLGTDSTAGGGAVAPSCPGGGRAAENSADGMGRCPECRQPYPLVTDALVPAHPKGIPWQDVDDLWQAHMNDTL